MENERGRTDRSQRAELPIRHLLTAILFFFLLQDTEGKQVEIAEPNQSEREARIWNKASR
jgi:hypothetical protein